jgi:hypothetical protein
VVVVDTRIDDADEDGLGANVLGGPRFRRIDVGIGGATGLAYVVADA